jgi:hypothetical protein
MPNPRWPHTRLSWQQQGSTSQPGFPLSQQGPKEAQEEAHAHTCQLAGKLAFSCCRPTKCRLQPKRGGPQNTPLKRPRHSLARHDSLLPCPRQRNQPTHTGDEGQRTANCQNCSGVDGALHWAISRRRLGGWCTVHCGPQKAHLPRVPSRRATWSPRFCIFQSIQ